MCRRAGLLCYDIGDTWEGAMCGAGSGWRAGDGDAGSGRKPAAVYDD